MSETKRSRFLLGARLTICTIIIGLMIWAAIPAMRRAKVTADKNACVANLKQIDGCSWSWSLENKKEPDDLVDIKTASSYLKGGILPTCPAGGSYQVNRVKDYPTCTLGPTLGHSLR